MNYAVSEFVAAKQLSDVNFEIIKGNVYDGETMITEVIDGVILLAGKMVIYVYETTVLWYILRYIDDGIFLDLFVGEKVNSTIIKPLLF
ncbi:TPA: hypothetical protein QC445_003447 [Bacillus cereus]|uniref:hypothetical protein n=1 Tax=Bacillus thuringiensis TaxID=1428 RepID=UPI000BF32D5B|nr:hypothetical protein [Bacillus thuringiensis]PFF57727.1 hypothetical protein CN358_25510 [Bacillus thuringiensis]PGN27917.1 hypothetical protein CN971_24175 [Bacillus thuringiensis]HDR8486629.1 hypothetical protein [Bacillus cereus]